MLGFSGVPVFSNRFWFGDQISGDDGGNGVSGDVGAGAPLERGSGVSPRGLFRVGMVFDLAPFAVGAVGIVDGISGSFVEC